MIIFKTTGIFYEKEHSGKKRNTVRLLTEEEHDILSRWIDKYPEKWIRIRESYSSTISFQRKLTDISCISKEILSNNYIYVFSW